MSVSSLDKSVNAQELQHAQRWRLAAILPLWVLVGIGMAQVILVGVLITLRQLGVSFVGVNETVLSTVVAASVYLLAMVIIIGLPWVKKYRTTKTEIGLTRLPTWTDIGLAPVAFVVYLLGSAALIYLVSVLVPSIDMKQVQEVGFSNLTHRYEYVLAFVTLVVVAPLLEEVLFRGYLYGKLRNVVPIWAAVGIVSVVFGFVHGQWNVAIDVFALSIVLCVLRELTGNIWSGVLLHMLKNSIAFYLIFINPDLLSTMVG